MLGTEDKHEQALKAVNRIYEAVAELEQLYPGRHFTPDGHMVGSLGEVVASEWYDIELYEASHPVHDAFTSDGKQVQIKATQSDKIGIGDEPQYLIVLKLGRNVELTEIYNGPGKDAWKVAGKRQKTGQCHITLSKLKALSEQVDEKERIPFRR